MAFTYSYTHRYLLFLSTFLFFTCSINEEDKYLVAKKNTNFEVIDQWKKSISREKLQFIAKTEMDRKEVVFNEKLKKIESSFEKTNPTKLYVHYMPWFQSVEIDGLWGQHWTMVNKNPDIINADGKREIAAHYYPLIGPYSTNDVDLQKYHLLLMKLAGIDGVIFDWYGSRNVLDFEVIKNGTESFLLELEDMGLSFAICFEDRAIGVEEKLLTPQEMVIAQNDIYYLEENYFNKENYIKINEENLLLVFGPQYIDQPEDWNSIFSKINTPVTVNALWGSQDLIGDYADGEFAWIDKSHLSALEGYYQWVADFEENTIAGAAYVGLNDFYVEGLWREENSEEWSILHEGTTVFQETLNLTSQYPVDFIQLITWNDFGEGTMMEPTIEFGYSFLEELQDFAGVEFSHDDLRVPYYIYMFSKQHKNNPNAMYFIDLAYYHACNSNLQYAKTMLSIVSVFYN